MKGLFEGKEGNIEENCAEGIVQQVHVKKYTSVKYRHTAHGQFALAVVSTDGMGGYSGP